MSSASREIESRALKLSPAERARIAERLISSLDDEFDADAEEAWVREGERRLKELYSGAVKGKSAQTVFRKVRAALR